MNKVSEVTTRNRVTKSKNPNQRTTTTTIVRTNPNRAPRKRKQPATPPRRVARQTKLSPCSEKYLRVIANPFSNIDNVCIPDLLDIPSFKCKVKARGSIVIGETGFGFLVAQPARAVSSDTNCLFWTSSAYNANTVAYSGDGVEAGSFAQLPYAAADFGNDADSVRARIVGLGIRVRYIGTNLYLGGRAVLYRPTLFGTISGVDSATALNNRTTITLPTTRAWKALAYQPLVPEQYEYSTDSTSASYALAILLEGSAGNLYEFEAVAYVEYIGAVVNATGSDSDIVGMSAIRQTINKVATIVPADDGWFGKLYQSVGGYVGTTIADPAFQQKAWTAVTSTLSSAL